MWGWVASSMEITESLRVGWCGKVDICPPYHHFAYAGMSRSRAVNEPERSGMSPIALIIVASHVPSGTKDQALP